MGGVKDQGAWSMNDWEDKLIDNLLNFAGTPKVSNFFLLECIQISLSIRECYCSTSLD